MTATPDTRAERIQQIIEKHVLEGEDPTWALAWATLQSAKCAFRAAVAMEQFVAALNASPYRPMPSAGHA